MPAQFRIYNTLTRKVEDFRPLNEGKVSLYACGMTVYDHAHVGHARSFVVFDAFGGTRRHTGFEPNPSIISLFEDTNSKPCSVFYVHFSSRDWSILRFYPPSVRRAARLVSSRRRSTRNETNERARVEREGARMGYIARAFCSAYTRTRRREVA